MERLARRRGHALSWRSPAATLGLTAVLGAGIVGVAIGRDLWIGSDRALTIPLLLLADVVVLALMAVVVRAVRLGRGDLGLAPPGLQPAVIGGAVAVAMLIAAGTWPHWWRPGLAAPGVALVILAATVEE
ncbi:MAG TPA: hypothetical protein VET65_11625, partial [Candidatus Limnocylindrales bacterium]|nr:hypothetical protein [Candidatus Limnocylindrales bacterium]